MSVGRAGGKSVRAGINMCIHQQCYPDANIVYYCRSQAAADYQFDYAEHIRHEFDRTKIKVRIMTNE